MIFKVYNKDSTTDNKSRELLGVLDEIDVKIGRQVEPGDILIKSTSISREHGIFKIVNGRWYYSDLGSSNGSFAESRRLVEGEYFELYDGLELTLSDRTVLIELIKAKEEKKIEELKDDIKISPDSHVNDKKTYVFTPDMLNNLRKNSGVNTGNINRPAYRGRRITDSPGHGVLNDTNSLILIILGVMVLIIFLFILLFLFL